MYRMSVGDVWFAGLVWLLGSGGGGGQLKQCRMHCQVLEHENVTEGRELREQIRY